MTLILNIIVALVAGFLAGSIAAMFRIYKLSKAMNEQRKKTQEHINRILDNMKKQKFTKN